MPPICGSFVASVWLFGLVVFVGRLRSGILIAFATWELCLSWSPQWRATFTATVGHIYYDFDRPRYVGPLLRQLVVSVGHLRSGILIVFATWDLCRLSWSTPIRGTFAASLGRLRCGTVVAFAMRLDHLRYGFLVVSATFISTK